MTWGRCIPAIHEDGRVSSRPVSPLQSALPARSGSWYLLVGVLLAIFAAVGTTFVAEYFDDSFRTPEEMRRELSIPVIAAIPYCPALRLTSDVDPGLDTGTEVA